MEQNIARYFKSHIMTMLIVILSCFLLLFLGEFFLYRKIMYLNQIISEGFMQIKETGKDLPLPTIFMTK